MSEFDIHVTTVLIGGTQLREEWMAFTSLGGNPAISSDVSDTERGAVLDLIARINNNFERAHLGLVLEMKGQSMQNVAKAAAELDVVDAESVEEE